MPGSTRIVDVGARDSERRQGRNDARSRFRQAANCGVPYVRQIVRCRHASEPRRPLMGRSRSLGVRSSCSSAAGVWRAPADDRVHAGSSSQRASAAPGSSDSAGAASLIQTGETVSLACWSLMASDREAPARPAVAIPLRTRSPSPPYTGRSRRTARADQRRRYLTRGVSGRRAERDAVEAAGGRRAEQLTVDAEARTVNGDGGSSHDELDDLAAGGTVARRQGERGIAGG